MVCIKQLDSFFEHLSTHTPDLLPDGILDINVQTLHNLQLLSDPPEDSQDVPASATLQAVESDGRITLYNDTFALWIVPQQNATPPATITFIARKLGDSFSPEAAFRTKGIYNRSKTILRIIDRFLSEIQENESVIDTFEHPRT